MLNDHEFNDKYQSIISGQLAGAELVIGLVGAVGTNLKNIVEDIAASLKAYKYSSKEIHISDLIGTLTHVPNLGGKSYFDRTNTLMTAGDSARKETNNNAILALAAAERIYTYRMREAESGRQVSKHAFIVNSLKHPSEVTALRKIYGTAFILIGVYAKVERRRAYLIRTKKMSQSEALRLMERDEAEGQNFGQKTRDTFHLSDFFVHLIPGGKPAQRKIQARIGHFLEIVFGHPYRTPTFDEYAMFMAFAAAVRSSDLSRQVGAVVARGDDILASGANECPRAGGGTYWPNLTKKETVEDTPGGREYTLGHDTNDVNKARIIRDSIGMMKKSWKGAADDRISKDGWAQLEAILKSSPIQDITEYGRVVHAEMTALLTCARNGVSCRDATLYVTTFPCHNCAKHIIAAGIKRVVYVEPYPKSRALDFHSDSAISGFVSEIGKNENRVVFEPFVGVGPRSFYDLFSMNQGSGYPLKRKDKETGKILTWNRKDGIMRIPELPWSYLRREAISVTILRQHVKGSNNGESQKNQSRTVRIYRRGTTTRKK